MVSAKYSEIHDGNTFWYKDAKCTLYHREDGPAIICTDGTLEWYLSGKQYVDKKKYQQAAKLSDEDMTMLLLKYNWP